MNYRNGREAKNGDQVIQLTMNDPCGIAAVGVVFGAKPGNNYDNYDGGMIASTLPTTTTWACMCDCLHLDDVVALLKEKGFDKRPSGK